MKSTSRGGREGKTQEDGIARFKATGMPNDTPLKEPTNRNFKTLKKLSRSQLSLQEHSRKRYPNMPAKSAEVC